MELIEYIRLFRRWFWLIFLTAFVAGGIGFITRSSQQPTYRAETKIIIGSILQNPDPDSVDIRAPVDLTATYSEIVRTNDVLQATINTLDLPMTGGKLRNMISTRTVPDTSLLVITITYEDPILATDIANELSAQLILASPSNLTPEQVAQIDIANAQITTLTQQLDVMQPQLEQIDAQLAEVEDEDTEEFSRLEEQRTTLVDQINQATANIAQFTDTISRYQTRTGALEIIQTATIPTKPIGTSSFSTMLLSAMVGATLATGVVLLIEYLNDTLRTTDEVTRTLSLPVLGVISRFGGSNSHYPEQLISTRDLLFSRTAEEYRNLRTNLLFTSSPHNPRIFVVTSPGPQDGKSITIANLAVSMAMADLRVLLIDADLRRPKLHTIFGLRNDLGLTTLTHASPQDNGLSDISGHTWKQCLQDPGIANLRVITSGYIPQNPTELLGSLALKHWTDVFRRDLGVDVILFDTPPCLIVADSVVLSSLVDAQTVLVVQANATRRTVALKAKERFMTVDREIVGTVLNAANPRDEEYYGYGYYSYYYEPDRLPAKQEFGKN